MLRFLSLSPNYFWPIHHRTRLPDTVFLSSDSDKTPGFVQHSSEVALILNEYCWNGRSIKAFSLVGLISLASMHLQIFLSIALRKLSRPLRQHLLSKSIEF